MLETLLAGALSIGAAAQWLALLSILLLAWVVVRGGGAGALSILQTSNAVLEQRVREQDRLVKQLTAQVADLGAKTDVALALRPILEWTHTHEQRDQERFERTLLFLTAIAAQLGVTGDPAEVIPLAPTRSARSRQDPKG